MNEHDDAYVDAMLMVDMQANTRSVTYSYVHPSHSEVFIGSCLKSSSAPTPSAHTCSFSNDSYIFFH